jgi:hypothetical protein
MEKNISMNIITLDFANDMAEDNEDEEEAKTKKVSETRNQTVNKQLLK